eukprot:1115041-Amphidinium_carterae.1
MNPKLCAALVHCGIRGSYYVDPMQRLHLLCVSRLLDKPSHGAHQGAGGVERPTLPAVEVPCP